jgi:molybdopterin/thiamine biosynthesis adenylyltransferase
VEIAKNIVLAGCKELILYDETQGTYDDLCGQFFITREDIEKYDYTKSRAHLCKDKLQ